MNINLTDQVAIVTGASRGIGYGIAEVLANAGANLILMARSETEQFDKAYEQLCELSQGQHYQVYGDIGDPATAHEATKLAHNEFRKLNIVVNNAGILDDGLIGMISEASIDATLSTNVKGVINMTQASTRLMSRGGGGTIVNVSSIIGRFGNTGQLVYGASKAAVIGATMSAAKELAPGNIRVNAIAPGYINTDMIKHIDPETDAIRRGSIGMARIGQPEDIANLALFLCSDLSSYITGQVIGVDGGMVV